MQPYVRDKIIQAAHKWNVSYAIFDQDDGLLSESFQKSLDYTRETREKENNLRHNVGKKHDDYDARAQKLSSSPIRTCLTSIDKEKKGDDNDNNDDDDDDDDDDNDEDFCKRYISDLIKGKKTATQDPSRGVPKKRGVAAIGSESKWKKFLSFKDRQIRQEMQAINRARSARGGAILTRSSSKKGKRPTISENKKQKQLDNDKEDDKEEEEEEEDHAMESSDSYKRQKISDDGHNLSEPNRVAAELARLKSEEELVSKHTNTDKVLFLPGAFLLLDDVQIGSQSQGKELSGESKDKKKHLRVLQMISQIFSYMSNHLSLNVLVIGHDINLSGSGGRSGDYVRLIRSNINFWLLFPLSTREIRSLLVSYTTGTEYSAIRDLISTALQPNHTVDDPYTSERVSITPCLGFFFPNAASDRQVLNWLENPLNAIFQDNSPLLPLATLSHTVLANQTAPSTAHL